MPRRDGAHLGTGIGAVNAGEPGLAQQQPDQPGAASGIQNTGIAGKAQRDKASYCVSRRPVPWPSIRSLS